MFDATARCAANSDTAAHQHQVDGRSVSGEHDTHSLAVVGRFATSGSPEHLLEHLRRFREHAVARWKAAEAIFRPYLAGEERFPDRTHVNVLAATLVLETARTEAGWADRAIAEVRTWRSAAAPEHREAAYAALRAALDDGAP